MTTLEFHVAPGGRDDGAGSLAQPLRTVAAARDRLRQARRDLEAVARAARVWLRSGTHYLERPLELGPEDSDTTYAAWPGDGAAPTLSAGFPIAGEWRPFRDHILVCRPEGLPADILPAQLFIDGRRQTRARYPNAADGDLALTGADAWPHRELRCDPSALSGRAWARPEEALVHCLTRHRWGSVHWALAGVDPERGTLRLGAGGWQMAATFQGADGGGVGAGSPFFVENVFEELDSPGEWYFDRRDRALYLWPPAGFRPGESSVEVDRHPYAVVVRGTPQRPVRGVGLRGLRVAGTSPTYLLAYEEPSLGDWALHAGGALLMRGVEDCAADGCLFDEVGGNAVFIGGHARGVRVEGCTIRRAGDSGVCLVGRSHLRTDAVHRCDRCGAEHGWDWDEPSEEVPTDCRVRGNRIEGIGVFGKQTAGVFTALARRITIAHNRIAHVPRAAICLNDGVFGGQVVEWNDVEDTVRQTGDHGPLNAWGRDRHWCRAQSHGAASHGPAGDVRRDGRETTVIRFNRFRDRRGWGIDLDDGASNYHVHSNLCLGIGVKLREGDLRVVENNIFIRPAHPTGLHVGYEGNADRFEGNVVVAAAEAAATTPAPVVAPGRLEAAPNRDIDFVPSGGPAFYEVIHPPRRGPLAACLDRNLFWDGAGGFAARVQPRDGAPEVRYGLEGWRALGHDRASVLADPLFVDARAGDYRLRPDSPALALGFRPWDLDGAGLPPGFREWAEAEAVPETGAKSDSGAAAATATKAGAADGR